MTKLVLFMCFRHSISLDLFHKYFVMVSRVSAAGVFVSLIWSYSALFSGYFAGSFNVDLDG